eukprot:TRINITY_DN1263_c0_g1_i2.p1 TRINITY_DN1263_c0_g1~~TRINITY_DN1263_c0_g1_i2.p1  ORF type:complete len:289 (+),score=51.02 TRINITY_DN1263_c0_g1_i2:96-962(+)
MRQCSFSSWKGLSLSRNYSTEILPRPETLKIKIPAWVPNKEEFPQIPLNKYGKPDLTAAPEDRRHGAILFSQKISPIVSASTLKELPSIHEDMLEIAFAGRSNVGKSSLLNELTRWTAKGQSLFLTSSTPGRTQSLDFFGLGTVARVVDMPGYGYAQAPKVRVKQWQELVNSYVSKRTTLARVCLLIDVRHGLMKEDYKFIDLMEKAERSFQFVLTKCDKISQNHIDTVVPQLYEIMDKKKWSFAFPQIICTSCVEKTGIDELMASLALCLGIPEIEYRQRHPTPDPE